MVVGFHWEAFYSVKLFHHPHVALCEYLKPYIKEHTSVLCQKFCCPLSRWRTEHEAEALPGEGLCCFFAVSKCFTLGCVSSWCINRKTRWKHLELWAQIAKAWDVFLIYCGNYFHLYLASFWPPRKFCLLHKWWSEDGTKSDRALTIILSKTLSLVL